MSTATIPLHDLARQITAREAELAKLRQEYAQRNSKLTELNRRKEALQQQLQQLEKELQEAGKKQDSHAPAKAPVAKKATPMPSAAPKLTVAKTSLSSEPMSLPKFLVHLVEQADHPLSAKELAQEVVRRKYPSKSKDLAGMVETRVSELVRKGILGRTADKTALVVAHKAGAKSSSPTPSSKKTESRSSTSSVSAKTTKTTKTTKSTKASKTGRGSSLKQMLHDVLAASSVPMKTTELAQAVLKRGYETASKDFKNVIWVCIGDMESVENIRGQGYRLKKGKAAKK
jgi:hypothetical protein